MSATNPDLPEPTADWPEDVAEIYKELDAEDRQLAERRWPSVKRTWPEDHGCGTAALRPATDS